MNQWREGVWSDMVGYLPCNVCVCVCVCVCMRERERRERERGGWGGSRVKQIAQTNSEWNKSVSIKVFFSFSFVKSPPKKSPKFFVTACFKYSVTYLSLPKAQTAFPLLSFHDRGEGELISVISACKQQSSINYGWQNHPGRRSQADYSEGWSQQTVMPQYSDL